MNTQIENTQVHNFKSRRTMFFWERKEESRELQVLEDQPLRAHQNTGVPSTFLESLRGSQGQPFPFLSFFLSFFLSYHQFPGDPVKSTISQWCLWKYGDWRQVSELVIICALLPSLSTRKSLNRPYPSVCIRHQSFLSIFTTTLQPASFSASVLKLFQVY
jgi:hypothetical protein